MGQKVTVEQQYAVGVAFIVSMVQDTATLAYLLGGLTTEMKKAKSVEDIDWLEKLDYVIGESIKKFFDEQSDLEISVDAGHKTLYIAVENIEDAGLRTLFSHRMPWESVVQKMLPAIMGR